MSEKKINKVVNFIIIFIVICGLLLLASIVHIGGLGAAPSEPASRPVVRGISQPTQPGVVRGNIINKPSVVQEVTLPPLPTDIPSPTSTPAPTHIGQFSEQYLTQKAEGKLPPPPTEEIRKIGK